jgi:nucleoside-diphosphate-sugar epimerase
LEFTLLTP